jgi:hypothetical protein
MYAGFVPFMTGYLFYRTDVGHFLSSYFPRVEHQYERLDFRMSIKEDCSTSRSRELFDIP